VAVVTRLAEEDLHVVRDLDRAGIDVFPVVTPSSTLMRLEYPSDNPDERTLVMAATAGSITPGQVRGRAARAFLVSASVRGEVQLDVLDALRITGATIALDVQGYVRVRRDDGRLEHAPWPERESVLSRVDVVKADAVEAEAITGEANLERAARALAGVGPREVVLTHRDGMLVLADGQVYTAPFRPRQLVGRSGRGDTCLGSYTAMRLRAEPAEAILWSAAVTSLKMEADGPFQSSTSEVEDLVARELGATLEAPGR
jgi:sugar/nucleoside kinase (ribokinase family)